MTITLELTDKEVKELQFALINDIEELKAKGVKTSFQEEILEKLNENYYQKVLKQMAEERKNEITPIF